MNVKWQLIRILEENKGTYISGEEIAARLSVSRNAVWKAVKALKSEGYEIDAITNKGYCLSEDTDVLNADEISSLLGGEAGKFSIELRRIVDSTNAIAKDLAISGENEGTIIISDEQTEGRGRKGRKFFSPHGTGVYMSIILRPKISAKDSIMITTAAAVAVSKAISAVSEKDAGIKWVNDIYIDRHKVCGILTEAAMNVETGRLDYAVLGIGLNVYSPAEKFPIEIDNIAGAIYDSDHGRGNIRNQICAEIIKEFFALYPHLESRSFVDEYRSRLFILGEKIFVINGNDYTEAIALDIDDDCRLKVRYDDGTERFLSSGEVSIVID